MKITWIGHSCFKIESGGYTIILDPYEDGSVPGLAPMREKANMVLTSHGHADHNAAGVVKIKRRGTNPFTITTIDSWHDDAKGALRGPSRIHILEDGETKLVHLGDLGCELEPDQMELVKGADVLLIPVGGHFTIDAAQAAAFVAKAQPRIAIPMHYRDDKLGYGYDVTGTVEKFMDEVKDSSVLPTSSIDSTDEMPTQAVVLRPVNAGRK